tara:strand:+ start:9115 stop:9402 length:288 start_codon:yes stop_codon:yes gene_type:complete
MFVKNGFQIDKHNIDKFGLYLRNISKVIKADWSKPGDTPKIPERIGPKVNKIGITGTAVFTDVDPKELFKPLTDVDWNEVKHKMVDGEVRIDDAR